MKIPGAVFVAMMGVSRAFSMDMGARLPGPELPATEFARLRSAVPSPAARAVAAAVDPIVRSSLLAPEVRADAGRLREAGGRLFDREKSVAASAEAVAAPEGMSRRGSPLGRATWRTRAAAALATPVLAVAPIAPSAGERAFVMAFGLSFATCAMILIVGLLLIDSDIKQWRRNRPIAGTLKSYRRELAGRIPGFAGINVVNRGYMVSPEVPVHERLEIALTPGANRKEAERALAEGTVLKGLERYGGFTYVALPSGGR